MLDDGQQVPAGAPRGSGSAVGGDAGRHARPAERAEAGDPGPAVALFDACLDDLRDDGDVNAAGEQAQLPVERVRRSFDGVRRDAPGFAGLFEEACDAPDLGPDPGLDGARRGGRDARALGTERFARDREAVRGVVDRTDQLLVLFGGSHADLSCKWGATSAQGDEKRGTRCGPRPDTVATKPTPKRRVPAIPCPAWRQSPNERSRLTARK